MAKNMLYNIKKAATYHYVVASWFNSFYYEQKQIECKDTDFFRIYPNFTLGFLIA